MSKYYLAYGSNLSVRQMLNRCPDAVYVGRADLEDWKLMFRGSRTGRYLTIEPAEGYKVPCLAWRVSDEDERSLDRYEGYPVFYKKMKFVVTLRDLAHDVAVCELGAFAYVMVEGRPAGAPTMAYFETCNEGYIRFEFDREILWKAYEESAMKEEET